MRKYAPIILQACRMVRCWIHLNKEEKMKFRIKSLFLLLLLIPISCSLFDPSKEDECNGEEKFYEGVVIAYSLIGEDKWGDDFANIHVIENDKDNSLFQDDNIRRAFCSISPNGGNIAYLKNFAAFPFMSGIKEPSLCITKDKGNTENIIIPADSLTQYYGLKWLSNTELAIEKQKENKSYIAIINIKGETIKEFEIPGICRLTMLPDNRYLYIRGKNIIQILDVNTYEFLDINLDTEKLNNNQPLSYNNSLILYNYNNDKKYIQYNLNTFEFEELSINLKDKKLLYIDDSNAICLSSSYPSHLLLMDSQFSTLDSLTLNDMYFKKGLACFHNNNYYFTGEVSNSDDVSAIYKADFNNNIIEKITTHTEDNFILDINVYDFK